MRCRRTGPTPRRYTTRPRPNRPGPHGSGFPRCCGGAGRTWWTRRPTGCPPRSPTPTWDSRPPAASDPRPPSTRARLRPAPASDPRPPPTRARLRPAPAEGGPASTTTSGGGRPGSAARLARREAVGALDQQDRNTVAGGQRHPPTGHDRAGACHGDEVAAGRQAAEHEFTVVQGDGRGDRRRRVLDHLAGEHRPPEHADGLPGDGGTVRAV